MMKLRHLNLLTLSAALTSAAVSVPRAYGDDDPVAVVKEELKSLETRIVKLQDDRFEQFKAGLSLPDTDKRLTALEKQHADATAEMKGLMEEAQKKLGRLENGGGGEGEGERRSPGQQLVESKSFKDNVRPGERERFVAKAEVKALSTQAGSAAKLVTQPQRLAMFEAPDEPHIRDLFAQGTTTSQQLTFPVRVTYTNNAGMVAELAQKPESDMTFDDKTFPVRKIAHFVRLSDELLADAPAIQSYVDAQLIEGLKDKEDVQLIKGDGTGQNLTGVYTAAAVFNRIVANDTLLDKIRRATTQLRLAHYAATGLILSPIDWEAIELLKGTDSRYLWVTVPDGGQQRIWRVPVRDTTAMASGEWLLGNFTRGAQIFDRLDATVEMTNTNANDFELNRVTIRAEERLALVIYDTTAFVKNAPAT